MPTSAEPRSDVELGPKATILIVEDEAVIAEDLREYLQSLGYTVAAPASSAGEAILTVRSKHIDLVLMDISLHGRLEGLEATVEIEGRFGVPVVYLSGCTSPEIEASVICTQPYGLVPKPFEPEYLAKVIERALQGPGVMAGAPGH